MSMKKLILDRLVETIKNDALRQIASADDRAAQAGSLLASLRMEFARASERLTKTTKELDILQQKVQQGDAPLTELYRAAENIARATTHAQVRAALPRLIRALEGSAKYIDQIPF